MLKADMSQDIHKDTIQTVGAPRGLTNKDLNSELGTNSMTWFHKADSTGDGPFFRKYDKFGLPIVMLYKTQSCL